MELLELLGALETQAALGLQVPMVNLVPKDLRDRTEFQEFQDHLDPVEHQDS